MAEPTTADAIQTTLSSKAFGADAAKVAGLVAKLASDPNATGYDAARLVIAAGDIVAKVAGVAGELGEAVPLLGAMISIVEIGNRFAAAWQRDELGRRATERDTKDWEIRPSGEGGALVAADLPAAFDELLVGFGLGRTAGDRWPGGGRTLREGTAHRRRLARDDMAAGATYIKSNLAQGLQMTGSLADVVVPGLGSSLELRFGKSFPLPKHLRPAEAAPHTEPERVLRHLGKLRRAQRLRNQAAGAALLQMQLLIAYGYALLFASDPNTISTWEHESDYVERRATLAAWLQSPLNSEPQGIQLRVGLLVPQLRTVTNARWGAVQAAAKTNIKGV